MIDDPSLWREVERVVSHHQKISDPTPFDALNRLFREYFRGRKDVPNLGKDNCRVRMEKLGWKELDRIVRKDKKTRNPRHVGDPIVVVEFDGQAYLVDGRRRVNQCVHERCQEVLTVLFVMHS